MATKMKTAKKLMNRTASVLEYYSQYFPQPLSMKTFVDFGSKTGCEKESFSFLRKELLVRMANIMKEIKLLHPKIRSMPSVKVVQGWYSQSFEELVQFEDKNENSSEVLADFAEGLHKIKNRHSKVVETMAQGMIELQETYPAEYKFTTSQSTDFHNIHYFLDRFLTNRISIRMLISQHTLLYGSLIADHPRFIGSIDPNCDVIEVLQSAYSDARFLCEAYYLNAPEMEVKCHNPFEKEQDKIQIVYVPSHLLHMLFEVLKNSMRATVETHENSGNIPKISVLVCKGKEDLTIKIGDQGGGFSNAEHQKVFEYMYSTAPKPDYVGEGNAPLAGYGYGLPLSRLYARYFGGDLNLNSVEGFGTDAYIYLKVLSKNASECLPVYNTTASKMYQSDIPVSDWSSPKPWHNSNPRNFSTCARNNR